MVDLQNMEMNQDETLKGKTLLGGQLQNLMLSSHENLQKKESDPKPNGTASPDDPIISLNIQPGQTASAKKVLNSDSDEDRADSISDQEASEPGISGGRESARVAVSHTSGSPLRTYNNPSFTKIDLRETTLEEATPEEEESPVNHTQSRR